MDDKAKIAELERQLAERTSERDAALTRLDEIETGYKLRDAVRRAGVKGEAVTDAVNRGRAIFTTKDGALVDREGYRTPHSWLAGLKSSAPHLFEAKAEGDGHGSDDHHGGSATGMRRSEMTPAEKASFIGEHGVDKYMELPA